MIRTSATSCFRAWCQLASPPSWRVRVRLRKQRMHRILRRTPQLHLRVSPLTRDRRAKETFVTTYWARKTSFPLNGTRPISSSAWITSTWPSSRRRASESRQMLLSKRYFPIVMLSNEKDSPRFHKKIKYVLRPIELWAHHRRRPKMGSSRIHPLSYRITTINSKFWRAFTNRIAWSSCQTRRCNKTWCRACRTTKATCRARPRPRLSTVGSRTRATWSWCKTLWPSCEQKHFT